MSIRCGNCNNKVDTCDGYKCSNTFGDKSEIICEDYGEMHFCSSDCFYDYHVATKENCFEQEDD